MKEKDRFETTIDMLIRHAEITGYMKGMSDCGDAAMWLGEDKRQIDTHIAYIRRKERLRNRFMAGYGIKPDPLYERK